MHCIQLLNFYSIWTFINLDNDPSSPMTPMVPSSLVEWDGTIFNYIKVQTDEKYLYDYVYVGYTPTVKLRDRNFLYKQ